MAGKDQVVVLGLRERDKAADRLAAWRSPPKEGERQDAKANQERMEQDSYSRVIDPFTAFLGVLAFSLSPFP
jgi:hypothetical protein